ncbi:recombinase family protein [Thetidibacter halocola]|uniref:Recombinase family protein n=1 Tax=Thetidibacter halocola TaxID=2827239 RepID=A0A8J8B5S7_9RHOB|nr:recombinase family protein [Thetidibacter halocola]MBS0122627.1 recombinase family protein [Thetidibacter halocola]
MQKAIGFYWTLPVPWARFTTLPEDIDAAAKASRTIRYQREVIRRFAKENKLALVAEKVFLEIAPDRSSRAVFDVLKPLKALCQAEEAILLHVDFARVQGWRSMAPLADWADEHGIRVETVFPGEIVIDSQVFDPHAHFSDWRARQREWSEGKADRLATARAAIERLSVDGLTNRDIAEALNARDIRSATGKPWTAETVRKLRPQKAP